MRHPLIFAGGLLVGGFLLKLLVNLKHLQALIWPNEIFVRSNLFTKMNLIFENIIKLILSQLNSYTILINKGLGKQYIMSLEIVGGAIELQGSPFSQAPTIKLYIKKKGFMFLFLFFVLIFTLLLHSS